MSDKQGSRRSFLATGAMISALTAAYGFFFKNVFRFVFPERKAKNVRPMFVAYAPRLPVGSSVQFYTPKGASVILTNTGQLQKGTNHGFIAFSSRCPHLGCNVHYAPKEERFVCPCHQGVFDQKGVAISGPPAQAGQRLSEFSVVKEGESVYVLVEVA
ncbi:MAG: Rieske (2Fe-2S) protein [Acidobacteria bacterium]|nr:Rieske (2Fe-2S) protein [Acidobacteriota bacterium]